MNERIRLAGIVERVTFHNSENGWSVVKVTPFGSVGNLVTVVVHQAKVFAGSSMEFWGEWCEHPKHGEQFKAEHSLELKPSSTAAIEKYLGSGLIKGVGPKIASRIVKYFQSRTLEVLEERIDELVNVPGIAERKLLDIKNSWEEHKAIRDVMLFLQGYGISTLYAVKIFKKYGKNSIEIVSQDPYQLAKDIHGIGFFSADKIALSMGFKHDGEPRVRAGIKHVLAAAREEGHCYLREEQISQQTLELLQASSSETIRYILSLLVSDNEIKCRSFTQVVGGCANNFDAYYSNSLFFAELYVAQRVQDWIGKLLTVDLLRVKKWVESYCGKNNLTLSNEQRDAVVGISQKAFSILTGGPGCGKTTTTKAIVRLFLAMRKRVVLAAPTGRAAQRMSDVIGVEARTIHRLLEWLPAKNSFKKCEAERLDVDVIIVDECSMLDIELTAALLKAIPPSAQVVLIGDPDQLPSVGAGNVLQDLLHVTTISSFRLTKIFRQAEESTIIRFAHQINKGEIPAIPSPTHDPETWQRQDGCLFIDSEEATQEQLRFFRKAKAALRQLAESGDPLAIQVNDKVASIARFIDGDIKVEKIESLLVQEFKDSSEIHAPLFSIPEKFKNVDLHELSQADSEVKALRTLLSSVHPWSSLHFGLTGLDVILRVYKSTIRKYFGVDTEIQVLTPQIRGSLGAAQLNVNIQAAVNPQRDGIKEITLGGRTFREGDRVIQTRNNYDLGVFNGDIGRIISIDLEDSCCCIQFDKNPPVTYTKEDLLEISLAYAITIHKSQGSEFDAVIIPVANQHFRMLFRNLIYTGLTRAKKVCIFVGSRKALALAVKQMDNRYRQTGLSALISC